MKSKWFVLLGLLSWIIGVVLTIVVTNKSSEAVVFAWQVVAAVVVTAAVGCITARVAVGEWSEALAWTQSLAWKMAVAWIVIVGLVSVGEGAVALILFSIGGALVGFGIAKENCFGNQLRQLYLE